MFLALSPVLVLGIGDIAVVLYQPRGYRWRGDKNKGSARVSAHRREIGPPSVAPPPPRARPESFVVPVRGPISQFSLWPKMR